MGSRERPAVRPVPALRGPLHDGHFRPSRRRRAAAPTLMSAGRRASRPRRSRASPSASSRTRQPHRCRRAAGRYGARLWRLRCGRRLGLEDGVRRLRSRDRLVPPQVRPSHPRPSCLACGRAAHVGQGRRFCRPIRADPRRARHSSSSRRRSSSPSLPPRRPR